MRLNRTEIPSLCSKDPMQGVVEIPQADAAPEWDAFVYRHPLGLVYHLSSWRRMIEQAFPHIRGRYLVLRDPGDGEIRAGLPVYAVKSWLLGNRMVSVPFASFCDPLVSSAEELRGFLPAIDHLLREQNGRSFSIRSLATRHDIETHFGCPESVYKHHYLPLDRSPEKMFASFAKSSICQKIQKAVRAGVTVVEVYGPKGMQTCHAILARTRRKVSRPPFPLSFFLAMERMLSSRNLRVFLALQRGEAVGCHLVLTFKDLWISEYSGNTEGAIHGVNQLLYWETIKAAQTAGATKFSFGRTSASNTGLLAYKRRWATIEEEAGDFRVAPAQPTLPQVAREAKNRETGIAHRALQFVVRRSPAPVCDMIGRFCYRHLG